MECKLGALPLIGWSGKLIEAQAVSAGSVMWL